MPTAPQDTEITLGTGRMLALFFAFVLVCAVFFAIGFSLGRRTASAGVGRWPGVTTGASAATVRPSAARNDAPQKTPQSGDFSFYKAVGEKNANSALAAPDAKAQPADATAAAPAKAATDAASAAPASSTSASSTTGSYYVQVAAVTRQEDAEALVEALKKKQYPAFANNASADKYYRVQVGPYADFKDADAMRARLVSDGYNPIVKK
jgi:cell division septation protein DedD